MMLTFATFLKISTFNQDHFGKFANMLRQEDFSLYLLENTIQVFTLGFPKLNLYIWPWIQTFEEWLSRISFKDVFDLMSPVDDHRLNGMY